MTRDTLMDLDFEDLHALRELSATLEREDVDWDDFSAFDHDIILLEVLNSAILAMEFCELLDDHDYDNFAFGDEDE